MSNDNKHEADSVDTSADSVSRLLKEAKPRAPAPPEVRARAFNNVREHWLQNNRKKRLRRQSFIFGLAATVLIACGFLFVTFTGPDVTQGIQVASVSRISGPDLHLTSKLADRQESLVPAASLKTGDLIETGQQSRLAIKWGNGGSLRIAQNSQVELLGDDRILVRSGKVYFDSVDDHLGSPTQTALIIQTPLGEVTHLGTQFTAEVTNRKLGVNVREGRVEIRRGQSVWSASAGNGIVIDQGDSSERFELSPYGGDWTWVQDIAPAFASEGRTVHAVLKWISRELGYSVLYQSPVAQQMSESVVLTGLSPLGPREALEALSFVTEMQYTLEDGVVRVDGK